MSEVRVDEECMKCGIKDFNFYPREYFDYPNKKVFIICKKCKLKVKTKRNPLFEEIQQNVMILKGNKW